MTIRSVGTPRASAGIATTTRTLVDVSDASSASVQVVYSDAAPAVKTFSSATYEVQTLTFPAFAGITDRDYIIVYDAAGLSYAVYMDKTGTSLAPTGALYTAVAAGRKSKADISGDTTAAQVAARVELALNALTGFTAAVTTDDTAADGTMTLTQTAYGPTTNPIPKNLNDAGAGSLQGVQSTAGYTSSLDEDEEYITISSHPYVTGTKVALTTAGGLPTGLSATDYYVISVDANTIQLASSLANAAAGTAVDFDDDGNGLHTLTTATSSGNVAKLQESNDGTNWVDVSGATVTIATSTSSALWNYTGSSRYLGVLYTPSAGQVNLAIYSNLVKQS